MGVAQSTKKIFLVELKRRGGVSRLFEIILPKKFLEKDSRASKNPGVCWFTFL
jgi:hypothetical protein